MRTTVNVEGRPVGIAGPSPPLVWQARRVAERRSSLTPGPSLIARGRRARRYGPRLSPGAAALVLATVAAAIAVVVVLTGSGSGTAPRVVESIFQDDKYLVYSPTATVARTLRTLRGLGVDRIRVSVLWSAITRDRNARTRPRGFDATNPAAYGSAAWAPYDRVVALARENGIAVAFNVTAPGPLWAMGRGAPDAKTATHYRPSASDFGNFVAALGRRYSGSYTLPAAATARSSTLPRVSFWTIWNEPNQPGWLAPQWRAGGGHQVMSSPGLYRSYVDAAFSGLKRTGHDPSADTVLIGELAPDGSEHQADADPIPPLPFIRALYCVDANDRPLRGVTASDLSCPESGAPGTFVSAHPGLFGASGFAHHPYSFFLAPSVHLSDPNFAALADLPRLEQGLDGIFASYGVQRRLPLYLTEYGYGTNPPNPYRGVPPARQSAYLNQAQYMAWENPRVRSMAQFLLYDSPPNASYPRGTIGYWSTFQTGLSYLDGVPKPSLNSYRLPIFIPDPVAHGGAPVQVWGMLRLAPNDARQSARIEWRPLRGGYRTLTTISTSDPSGFLTARVALPGPGALRIAWTAATGQVFHSRGVGVRIG